MTTASSGSEGHPRACAHLRNAWSAHASASRRVLFQKPLRSPCRHRNRATLPLLRSFRAGAYIARFCPGQLRPAGRRWVRAPGKKPADFRPPHQNSVGPAHRGSAPPNCFCIGRGVELLNFVDVIGLGVKEMDAIVRRPIPNRSNCRCKNVALRAGRDNLDQPSLVPVNGERENEDANHHPGGSHLHQEIRAHGRANRENRAGFRPF